MLHQISWSTYAVRIFLLIVIYYLYVGLTFYRKEIRSAIFKLTGTQPALKISETSDLQIPDYNIMGKAQPDDVEFVSQEELSFAPADIPDEAQAEQLAPPSTVPETDSRLIGDFSEMVSEVKTLIRVIKESSESKENFEMLFRLIVQKYPSLTGTAYQQQINDFLIAEDTSQFPFALTNTDLENYWIN